MATLAKSELGETAARLLREAGGGPVLIVDGERKVGALVPIEYIRLFRQMAFARMKELSEDAGPKVETHAAELGIAVDELVERLLEDRDEL